VNYSICPKITFATAFGLSLILGGCATQKGIHQPTQPRKMPWKKRVKQLRQIQKWQINGATSITVNQQTQMMHFTWDHQNNHYNINFYGPMHLNSAQLDGEPGQVKLKQGDKTFRAKTPEQLMHQQLGWFLPVSQLKSWIKGIPASQSYQRKELDNQGHLQTLRQAGWTIRYASYQGYGPWDVPKSIKLNHKDIHVKITIQRWQIPIKN